MSPARAEPYGDLIADLYDTLPVLPTDGRDAVGLLVELAGDGRALELGIGTGRLAIPLAARGVTVDGIDSSAAMVERLRAKPGGEALDVIVGDFADVAVEREYALVFVAFNTFFLLLTLDDQLRCLSNVARCLVPHGRFAIEVFVPDVARFSRGQNIEVNHVGDEDVMLTVAQHDAALQRIEARHVLLRPTGVRTWPNRLRYCYPTELDLAARLAGLRLEARWGGWRREPFTAASRKHVSVYAHTS
jgi:SAM-dependent methyltransferase